MNTLIFVQFNEFLTAINTWVLHTISFFGYPGLALVMFLENVFPPIPSELILPLAGSLTLEGRFSVMGISLVGMLGSVAGAWMFYGLGYWFEEKRVRAIIRKVGRYMLLSESDLDRSLSWFQRHGDWVIFFGRMIPMVRSLISIPAGLAKMNPLRFTLFTAVGTACWSFVLALAGRLLGQNWQMVEAFLSRYKEGVLIALAAAALVFVYLRLRARLQQPV